MLWKFATPMSVNEPYTAAVLTFPEKKRVKKCLCENFPKTVVRLSVYIQLFCMENVLTLLYVCTMYIVYYIEHKPTGKIKQN